MSVYSTVSFHCNRCEGHLTFMEEKFAFMQGWTVDKKDGTCLCPICVWELTGKLPPNRTVDEYYKERLGMVFAKRSRKRKD